MDLLQRAGLPTADINDRITFYVLTDGEKVMGSIGLEDDGQSGLLRSLSVEPEKRGNGYGNLLVDFLEDRANAKGIETLYLLTTTATAFFLQKNYVVISRSETPAFIQQTTEFNSTCPASAIIMKKNFK